MNKTHLIVASVLLCAACGGGGGGGGSSGVDRDTSLTDLTAAEVMDICEWAVAEGGGPGAETDCGDGVTVTNGTVAECVEDYPSEVSSDCTATVADVEDCFEAMNGDPCSFEHPECEPLFSCVPQ